MAVPVSTPFGVSDDHTTEGSTMRNLDLLASEQTRIQRTAARSEHRECDAHRREMDKRPGFGRMQDCKTQLRHSNDHARERGPQTDHQQGCGPRRYQVQDGWRRRSRRQKPRIQNWDGRCSA
jgi:hypothetical protein